MSAVTAEGDTLCKGWFMECLDLQIWTSVGTMKRSAEHCSARSIGLVMPSNARPPKAGSWALRLVCDSSRMRARCHYRRKSVSAKRAKRAKICSFFAFFSETGFRPGNLTSTAKPKQLGVQADGV